MPKEITYDDHALRFEAEAEAAGYIVISRWLDIGVNAVVTQVTNQIYRTRDEATAVARQFAGDFTVTIKAVRFGSPFPAKE